MTDVDKLDELNKLDALLSRATPGEWQLQDGCSWRRIGTSGKDGNVLRPYVTLHDNWPDLADGAGGANLAAIIAAVNWCRNEGIALVRDRLAAQTKEQDA